MNCIDIDSNIILARYGMDRGLLYKLVKIGDNLIACTPVDEPIVPIIDELTAIKAESVLLAGNAIATAFNYHYSPFGLRSPEIHSTPFASSKNNVLRQSKPTPIMQLQAVDGLEYLLWFHPSGYLREAALKKCDAGLPGAFWVAALAWGLMIGFRRFVKRRRSAQKESSQKPMGVGLHVLRFFF